MLIIIIIIIIIVKLSWAENSIKLMFYGNIKKKINVTTILTDSSKWARKSQSATASRMCARLMPSLSILFLRAFMNMMGDGMASCFS
jgi:hypothetical protein